MEAMKRSRGHHLTPEQRREAVAIIEALMAKGRHKHEIFALFKKGWGRARANAPLSARSCQALYSQAQANLRAAVGGSDDDLRAESYNVYRYILRKPDASDRDRILAQNAIDKLLGLPRPQRVAVQVGGRDAEEAEQLALARQRIVADPEASRLACELIERLADAEAEKRGGGPLPCGLRELDRPSPSDGKGEAIPE
jgi:hypothetical protein